MSRPLVLYLKDTRLPGRREWARIAPGAAVHLENDPSAAAPMISLVYPEGILFVRCLPVSRVPGERSRLLGIAQRASAAESKLKRLADFSLILLVTATTGLELSVIDGTVSRLQRRLQAFRHQDDALVDASGEPILELSGVPQLFDATPPPSPERVLCRARVLAAIAARGLLEYEDGDDVELQRVEILGWAAARGLLESEIEPLEREILETPIGALDAQLSIDATWRMEGLAVLVWALRGTEIPPPDELASPDDLFEAIGFLVERPAVPLPPGLRPIAVLVEKSRKLMGVHWRFRNASENAGTVDFAAFARENWFGAFDLEGIETVDGDLSVMGVTLAQVDPSEIGRCESAAQERHLAINWLLGTNELYSEVDASI